MRFWLFLLLLIIVPASEQITSEAEIDREAKTPPSLSGYEFIHEETQALQDDEFANPGMLWVDRGYDLYSTAVTENQSCSSCHGSNGEEFIGIADSYPRLDERTSELVNIENRINLCRIRYMSQSRLSYEHDDLLALTAYVLSKSRGKTINRKSEKHLTEHWEAGRDYFHTRRGQMNLSCSQCHDENWGKQMRGETISQGHSNGFPTYRFEWQSLGSLHRRFRDCDLGVRAEPHAGGSLIYTQLELYLQHRANGLTIESPSVRR